MSTNSIGGGIRGRCCDLFPRNVQYNHKFNQWHDNKQYEDEDEFDDVASQHQCCLVSLLFWQEVNSESCSKLDLCLSHQLSCSNNIITSYVTFLDGIIAGNVAEAFCVYWGLFDYLATNIRLLVYVNFPDIPVFQVSRKITQNVNNLMYIFPFLLLFGNV